MAIKTSILAPGYLVALKSSVTGGISYTREDIRTEIKRKGTVESEWNTKKTIANKERFDLATKARNDINTAIRSVCARTGFGLLCPLSREGELSAAIALAKDIRDAANGTVSPDYDVSFNVIVGRIAEDDGNAAKAIAAEVQELIATMESSIKTLDVKAIREAANAARQIGMMLSPKASETVNKAIDQARKAARTIVKRVEKNSEDAIEVLKEIRVDSLAAARFAFLETEIEAVEVAPLSAVDAGRFAFDDAQEIEVKVKSPAPRVIEVDDAPEARAS